ncbi:MAG: SdpI family protein [Clostridium sp.]
MLLFLLIFTTIISIANYLVGHFLVKYPPKDINGMIGYRTRKSSTNKRTWDFSQKYSGELYKKVSIVGFLTSIVLILIFAWSNNIEKIIFIVVYGQIIEVFIPIIITEKRLTNYIRNREYLIEK